MGLQQTQGQFAMNHQAYRFGRDSDAYRTFLITRQDIVKPRSLSSDIRRLALVAMLVGRSMYRMVGNMLKLVGTDLIAAPRRYCPERHYMRGPGPMTRAKNAR